MLFQSRQTGARIVSSMMRSEDRAPQFQLELTQINAPNDGQSGNVRFLQCIRALGVVGWREGTALPLLQALNNAVTAHARRPRSSWPDNFGSPRGCGLPCNGIRSAWLHRPAASTAATLTRSNILVGAATANATPLSCLVAWRAAAFEPLTRGCAPPHSFSWAAVEVHSIVSLAMERS